MNETNATSPSLLILGAGAFSPEVEELARLLGYGRIAFLDDNPNSPHGQPVLGPLSDAGKYLGQFDAAIVALGNNRMRLHWHGELKRLGWHIPALVHPTAYVSPDAVLSPGCILRARVVVSRFVRLGEAVILNAGAMLDHHVEIGDGCHILMGAVVRNMAKVEALSRVESLELVQ